MNGIKYGAFSGFWEIFMVLGREMSWDVGGIRVGNGFCCELEKGSWDVGYTLWVLVMGG